MADEEDLPTGIADFEAKQAQKIQRAREQDAASSTRFMTSNIVQNRRRTQLITLAVVVAAVGGVFIAIASMPSKPKPDGKQASTSAAAAAPMQPLPPTPAATAGDADGASANAAAR